MSTILKALRQSEARRSRHAPLSPAADPGAAYGPRRRDLAWLGAAVLAFGAVAAAVWYATGRDAPGQPERSERPARIAQVSLPPPAEPAAPARPSPEAGAPAAAEPEPDEPAAADDQPPAEPRPDEGAAGADRTQSPASEPPADAPEEPPRLDEFALLPRLSDLAPDRRQRLPELALNAHVYAERPPDRFVLINLTRYREGDPVAPGLLVAAIFAGGVVMEDDAGRFVLPRP